MLYDTEVIDFQWPNLIKNKLLMCLFSLNVNSWRVISDFKWRNININCLTLEIKGYTF